MTIFDNLSSGEFIALANAFALGLAEGKDLNELNSLANFFELVGQIMSTIAAQKQLLQSKETQLEKIKQLKKELKDLEKNL